LQPPSTALLTDRYELTMLEAAIAAGTADRRCVFEVFARRLPQGRRYGVVCGTGRLLEALADFRFDAPAMAALERQGFLEPQVLDYLSGWHFTGDIRGYAEGECFFAESPILQVEGTFAEAVVLETLVLSVLNHDCAVAAAASRMAHAAGTRPCLEMGSRRTHEHAAVAAARAAYVAGFAATSNLAAGERYGVPTAGTAAHAFTLLHDDERAAFAAQVKSLGRDTTLLVDTFDVEAGVRTAIDVAGADLGAIRLDSGDLASLAVEVRELLDCLGATSTRIVVTSDLDEYAIAALAAAPVDSYGVGTSVVTGSGAPTAGLVYKLVSVDGRAVAKRSTGKEGHGGKAWAGRALHDGVGIAEVVTHGRSPEASDGLRPLLVDLVVAGETVGAEPLSAARDRHAASLAELPHHALRLQRGEPALPTVTSVEEITR
jgi:nicotinate phosphoribosyltransferase